ncbi:hypothetical protein SAMN02745121_06427 [Nannocystis exedens]|uniref:Uncharacterized protein n=1 Tax=Nannocystis exedens TaxID=54 RepID=A0A1I2F1I5_9BACT|nr:hypothetical protein [Nannocystis exedens]PCC69619.1 hypothetical protein NAEX_02643 [Nannocystis exedens]SFE99254.1 hypothetical protein SAMN02745121_06427 [Nannocystis exedens]
MSFAARLFLAGAILSPACAGRSPAAPLTQAALRAALDRHTCARWEPEVRQWSLLLFDATCEPAPASGGLEALVRAAARRLRPLAILAEPAYDHFYRRSGDPASRSPGAVEHLADAAVWSDRLLSDAAWRALDRELAARGLVCVDCPRPDEPPSITFRWAEFFPYLAAYVWPVQFSKDAPVEIFTCTAIHGAAALPPDPLLSQAGRLAAFAVADDETAASRLRALAGQGSLAEVSRSIRDYLDSPAGRRIACAALADVAWFTGLRVSDC